MALIKIIMRDLFDENNHKNRIVMETPKMLLKSRRPPLPSTQLIESLIANKKPLNPHPTCSRSNSIRSLKTSVPKTSRSPSETRKFLINSSLPTISASNWCVVEGNTCRVLHGFKDIEVKEIASLTKIMTCWVCIKIIERGLCSLEDKVRISAKASRQTGTSADLQEGQTVGVLDLLYGLMLPSGNDAAWALAEHFGSALNPLTSKPLKQFICEMNKYARIMNLYTTYYANPHGLVFKKNVSCARDVCKLSCLSLKDPIFRRIVSTKVHNAEVTNENGLTTKVTWENTNKLLVKGFEGIKTGVTDNAGPCLATAIRGKMYIVITLLNSKSMDARWDEAQSIANWIMNSCE